jgi:tetratricopeptide (TPR) repeat protein
VQVFARSGKLKELIARAEAQLETSPNSQQVLQTLVDYYQADNQRDKVKTTYDRMAKLRPDDARLRFQIGQQLAQSNAPAEALPHFEAALKKEPTLFANQYSVVLQAYQRAGKTDEFVKLLESIDFKTFANNPYVIYNALQNLFRSQPASRQNATNREAAMAVFRKAWKELPDFRSTLLGVLYDAEFWKLPEVADYAREVVIPVAGKPIVNPWLGMDEVSIWGRDREVNNIVTRLIEVSDKQGRLDPLADEIAEALKRSPDWLGGKAVLAILQAKRGKFDEARAGLEPLTAKGVVIPLYARMVMAQELEPIEPLRDLALKLCETAMTENLEEIRSGTNGFEYGPGKLLVRLYQKSGRNQDARDFLLKYAANPANFPNTDPNYLAYLKINQS